MTTSLKLDSFQYEEDGRIEIEMMNMQGIKLITFTQMMSFMRECLQMRMLDLNLLHIRSTHIL